MIENMDSLPSVAEVYKRDLRIETTPSAISCIRTLACTPAWVHRAAPSALAADGRRPPLSHPLARPRRRRDQARDRHISRKRKEFFFDDDTFTDDLPRAEAIARELGKMTSARTPMCCRRQSRPLLQRNLI